MGSRTESLIIDQILVGRFSVFCYLITDPETREALLYDPGAEPKKILDRIRERNARLRWIVCSHTHPDHIGGITRIIKEKREAKLGIHEREVSRLDRFSKKLMVRLMGGKAPSKADFPLKDGDSLSLGSQELRVLHTPGHSPGSICLRIGEHLFTGDTLFVGGVGRTDLPGSSWEELSESIRTKILCLPGKTCIWPGHHYGHLTSNILNVEMQENPFLHMILNQGQPC